MPVHSVHSGLFVFVFMAAASAAYAETAIITPPELPAGFSIVETPRGPVMATAQGMTIYKQLPKGRAAKQVEVTGVCVFQCPSEWPPLKAAADAKPVGDFTIVTNAGGVRQWAYKNVPLETFVFDRRSGDTLGDDTHDFNGPRVPIGEAAWLESGVPPEKPSAPPVPTSDLPPEVVVQPALGGSRVFASTSGLTLYVREAAQACTGDCRAVWSPLVAGALARGIGAWSVVRNADGTQQWAHNGKPAFTYAKDRKPGDMKGAAGDWRALIEYQAPLPAEVDIRQTESGPVYAAKASGKTLYYQGYNHRAYQFLGFNNAPFSNCYNACAKAYPPLLASPDAKPVGEWWLFTRVDGAKQWAYRGNPVYTYQDDEPGRHLASYNGRLWTEAIASP